jgi:hypothetical protein
MASVRTLRPDPDHPGIVMGWPRPLVPDLDGVPMPHPWIADLLILNPLPDVQLPKNACRGPEAIRDWRCQICGERCEDEKAYAPILPESGHSWPPAPYRTLTVSGGPSCSIRCVRLAVAVCPHLAQPRTGIISYPRARTWENVRVHAQMVVTGWNLVETRRAARPKRAWASRTSRRRAAA